jgi:anti-sigma-K factor RskA
MDEQLQDEAAEYAMGQLSPEEASAFEARLRDEPELQRLVDELRETVATLAYAAPVRPLPGGLEQRVMACDSRRRISAKADAGTIVAALGHRRKPGFLLRNPGVGSRAAGKDRG